MTSNASTHSWVWDERWWFPVRLHREDGSVDEGVGWAHLDNAPGSSTYYPKVYDLHLGILVGMVLVIVRYILET